MNKLKLQQNIGANIFRLRKDYSLSMDELASMIGVTCAFLSSIEEGKKSLSVEKLHKVSYCFKISIDQIISSNLTGTQTFGEENSDIKMLINKIRVICSDMNEKELKAVIENMRTIKTLRTDAKTKKNYKL